MINDQLRKTLFQFFHEFSNTRSAIGSMRFYSLSPTVSAMIALSILVSIAGCGSESNSTPPAAASSEQNATDSTSTSKSNTPDNANDAIRGSVQVELAFASAEDIQAAINSLAGKPVVVDIWSTSCIPCMREFPNLVKLHNEYGDKIQCVSINVDYLGLASKAPESYQTKVLDFLTKNSAKLKNFLSTTPDSETLDLFGVSAMPAILLYDSEGMLIKAFTDANAGEDGLTYEGDVIPELKKLLADDVP